MIIHFICRGNTFRSRLAAAYFNSLNITEWQAISSGVGANKNLSGPICWYTKEILEKNNLSSLDKESWTFTTIDDIDKSDILIFMNKNCYDSYVNVLKYDLAKKRIYIWKINDIGDVLSKIDSIDKTKIINTANQIFNNIKNSVDNLVKEML